VTIETIDITDISQDPANVRKHSRRNLDAIKASLRAFGQQKPIVVDDRNVILAGNGTYEAAKELGWSEIQIVRTRLTGTSAVAYAIADNRTAELAEWDDTALAEQLRALQSEEFDVEAAGFTGEEIDGLIEGVGQFDVAGIDPPVIADGDRAPFQQMTFTLHDDQAELIKRAIESAKNSGPFIDTGNENGNGNALARIAEHYVGQG
jgi:ParB-like chromosome segregation protein Spo0J